MQPWKEIIDAKGSVVVGESKVELGMSACSDSECNLGNYFCDAMIHSVSILLHMIYTRILLNLTRYVYV